MEFIGSDLKDKVAIITGGTSGIGYGIAIGFARLGCNVIPTSRSKSIAREIEAQGVKSLDIITDVTRLKDVEQLVQKVTEEFGRIDIIVNSAGFTIRKPSVEITEEEWDEIVDINLKGTFLTCQKVGEIMLKQGYGSIINMASLTSFVAYPEVVPYCASKGGVIMLTKALAIEWAQRGVRVNAIAPGDIMTPLTDLLLAEGTERRKKVDARIPMGHLGKIEDIVGAAVYLASDVSRYVTGHTLVVDGGHLAQGI